MISAASFLIAHGLKNRVVRWVLRLRQPRYLAGAVLAGLYLWSFFGRRHATMGAAPMSPGVMNEMFGTVVAFPLASGLPSL